MHSKSYFGSRFETRYDLFYKIMPNSNTTHKVCGVVRFLFGSSKTDLGPNLPWFRPRFDMFWSPLVSSIERKMGKWPKHKKEEKKHWICAHVCWLDDYCRQLLHCPCTNRNRQRQCSALIILQEEYIHILHIWHGGLRKWLSHQKVGQRQCPLHLQSFQ